MESPIAQEAGSAGGINYYAQFNTPQVITKLANDFSYSLEKITPCSATLMGMLQDLAQPPIQQQFQYLDAITDTKMHKGNTVISKDLDKFNRYNNILPYKHSAVKLSGKTDIDKYINANYIHGIFAEKAFIATQGPVPDSFSKFWQMVWENKSNSIIMLCKEMEGQRIKCDRYWPSKNKDMKWKDYSVRLISEIPIKEELIVERKFEMKYKDETRQITQIHWNGWPDHGVPQSQDYPILEGLVQKVAEQLEISQIPIIHCSAGVGRTGTLIALTNIYMYLKYHSIKKTINPELEINIFDIVRRIREDRFWMVQTQDQYQLIQEISKSFIKQFLNM